MENSSALIPVERPPAAPTRFPGRCCRVTWFAFSLALAPMAILGVFAEEAGAPPTIVGAFRPPPQFANDLGTYKSPLTFDDGRTVRKASEWPVRRAEILRFWHGIMGTWPPLIERPRTVFSDESRKEGYTQRRVHLEVAPDRSTDGYLLVPDGPGPFPAVVVVFYEPETAIGLGKKPGRDFALQLVKRGFVALSIGTDPNDAYYPDREHARLQPLSFHAYVAANCYNALAALPEVDPARVGIVGHSYGGKWAMFASCLYDKFACGVWSDPGIVFDETRPNVNYWEPWYLGWEPGHARKPGVLTEASPRTGVYRRLMESGHDLHELHALMAPRPFLVSGGSEDPPERWRALNHSVAVNKILGFSNRVAMTNRPAHDPTRDSNEQIGMFLDCFLKPIKKAKGR